MKTKARTIVLAILSVLVLVCMLPQPTITPTADAATSTWDGTITTSFSGSGTAASPYIIDTAAKLAGVAQLTNNNTGWSGGKYFVLTVDIDLNNRQWTPIGIQRQNGGSTTYSENNAWFRGYFDGNGHVVKNVRVGTNTSSRASVKHVGLFGIVGSAGVIVNLGVETAQYYINHYCDDERVGGFVGYCAGVIQGCYARNVIINQNGVCVIGGFCGQATSSSTIYKSYAYNVDLTQGSGRKGGFVGDGDGTIAFSFVNYYPFKSDNSDGSFIYAYGETAVTGAIVGNGTITGYGIYIGGDWGTMYSANAAPLETKLVDDLDLAKTWDNPGYGRYADNDKILDGTFELPTGYHMSTTTTKVNGQGDTLFHYLVRGYTVIYDGNGHALKSSGLPTDDSFYSGIGFIDPKTGEPAPYPEPPQPGKKEKKRKWWM